MARNLFADNPDIISQPLQRTGTHEPQGRNLFAGPELQRTGLQPEQEQPPGIARTAGISVGRGLNKILSAIGVDAFGIGPETPEQQQRFQALAQARPVTTTAGEIVGEALPFAIGGGILTPLAATRPAQIGLQGLLGAAEGGLISRGQGGAGEEQIIAGGVGGALGAGLEAVSPVLGRIVGAVFRRVTGRQPAGALLTKTGTPTPELQQALDASGLTFQDVVDGSTDLLGAQAGADPAQLARKAFLESQGLVAEGAPTTAQVVRDATEFQAQQEAAKTSGRVRARLESQQGILVNRFDEAVAGTSGQAVTSGNPVADHVLNKSTELDNEISTLYGIARDTAQGGEIVDLSKTFNKLESMRPSDRLMKGAVSSIEGEAARLGILDPATGVSRSATVDESELLRKFSNQLFNSTSDFGKVGLRRFRNAIDDDVTKSAGEDVFKQGRKAKADFETNLSRSKISKFDKNQTSLVRDILENKINPDEFLEKTVLAKKYRASDLDSLKKYLNTGTPTQKEAGQAAFNDLRAETLDFIKNSSFIGPEDALGNRNLSKTALSRSMKKIGMEKIKVLFNAEERKFLSDMQKVSQLLEPVRGTALGKGPSAQGIDAAIKSLQRRIDKIPFLNVFVDLELGEAGKVLKGKPVTRQRELPTLQQLTSGAGQAGAIAATQQPGE